MKGPVQLREQPENPVFRVALRLGLLASAWGSIGVVVWLAWALIGILRDDGAPDWEVTAVILLGGYDLLVLTSWVVVLGGSFVAFGGRAPNPLGPWLPMMLTITQSPVLLATLFLFIEVAGEPVALSVLAAAAAATYLVGTTVNILPATLRGRAARKVIRERRAAGLPTHPGWDTELKIAEAQAKVRAAEEAQRAKDEGTT